MCYKSIIKVSKEIISLLLTVSYALSACPCVCVTVSVCVSLSYYSTSTWTSWPSSWVAVLLLSLCICVCTCDTQSQLLLLWRIRNIPLAHNQPHTLRVQYKYIFMCFPHSTPSSFVIYNIFGYAASRRSDGGCYNFSRSFRESIGEEEEDEEEM